MINAKYDVDFGFTEKEVIDKLTQYGQDGNIEEVRKWYDGFRIGGASDIYNP